MNNMNDKNQDTEHGTEMEPVSPNAASATVAADGYAASRKLKRTMLIVIAGMVVFAVVAIILINWIDEKEQGGDSETSYRPGKPAGVIFYEPDYDRTVNILEDPEYLELDRYISLTRGSYTVTLDTDDLSSYSPAVTVLCNLLDAIIRGDADTYNSLFSEVYYATPGNQPENPFTMQRVYHMEIEEISEQEVTSDEGVTYTEYKYMLSYEINRNDGTYRVDIGHDVSRPQYFILSDREGEIKIDGIVYRQPQ